MKKSPCAIPIPIDPNSAIPIGIELPIIIIMNDFFFNYGPGGGKDLGPLSAIVSQQQRLLLQNSSSNSVATAAATGVVCCALCSSCSSERRATATEPVLPTMMLR